MHSSFYARSSPRRGLGPLHSFGLVQRPRPVQLILFPQTLDRLDNFTCFNSNVIVDG